MTIGPNWGGLSKTEQKDTFCQTHPFLYLSFFLSKHLNQDECLTQVGLLPLAMHVLKTVGQKLCFHYVSDYSVDAAETLSKHGLFFPLDDVHHRLKGCEQ